MSYQECNSVWVVYVYKVEYLEVRKVMMQWWLDYLDVCCEGYVVLYIYVWQYKVV